jgi:23S rRNA (cytosine1962-C5)-methyltransferase
VGISNENFVQQEIFEPGLLLSSPLGWTDYELLDSGDGKKLERFGKYIFIRPEHQAIWKPALHKSIWQSVDGIYETIGDENVGRWRFQRSIVPSWEMSYDGLKFFARVTSSRHLGVFPEQAYHWSWIQEVIRRTSSKINVLSLFGYTGIATLFAARAGARVTHVDASKKSISMARENQIRAGLGDCQIRWIVDDALKFVSRELRRGIEYQGIVLDPPKFGRGPKGEIWECFDMLPNLLVNCRKLMGEQPLFIVLTAYAIRASALSIYNALQEVMNDVFGSMEAGELVTIERSAGRLLSLAIYSRWNSCVTTTNHTVGEKT